MVNPKYQSNVFLYRQNDIAITTQRDNSKNENAKQDGNSTANCDVFINSEVYQKDIMINN
jgi:hypothetical protein